MIWGAFSSQGKSKLAILDDRQDSTAYIEALSEFLLPYIDLNFGRECIFQ